MSNSNPLEELYKKIVISDDLLESDQETETGRYKIHDTEILNDLDSYISDNDDDEDEDEEDHSDKNDDGMQEHTIEPIELDDFATIPTSSVLPSEVDDKVVHVAKLDEIDHTDGSVLTAEPDHVEQDSTKITKSTLQKMNVQMLRTIVIRDGICTDPSKFKKLDLINMILESTVHVNI
jgi:hypothetical protein